MTCLVQSNVFLTHSIRKENLISMEHSIVRESPLTRKNSHYRIFYIIDVVLLKGLRHCLDSRWDISFHFRFLLFLYNEWNQLTPWLLLKGHRNNSLIWIFLGFSVGHFVTKETEFNMAFDSSDFLPACHLFNFIYSLREVSFWEIDEKSAF